MDQSFEGSNYHLPRLIHNESNNLNTSNTSKGLTTELQGMNRSMSHRDSTSSNNKLNLTRKLVVMEDIRGP